MCQNPLTVVLRGLLDRLAGIRIQDQRAVEQYPVCPYEAKKAWQRQAPKSDPRYYYRPWKTILVRTVADGGQSFYVQGERRVTVPRLHFELTNRPFP